METKKSDKANIENKRGMFFLLGTILGISLLVVALEGAAGSGDEVVLLAQGIVQEKYITISVVKKDIEEARTYFSRIGSGLTEHFTMLGSKCVDLDATERLRILHDFYRPGDEGGIIYNDPEIGVNWPIAEGMELLLSEKDTKWGGLKEYMACR